MKRNILEIQRAIVKLENPYPKDDLISNYQDFLKYRDFLDLYQFNIKVLEALIQLSNNTWLTGERIDRMSILWAIKKYGYETHHNGYRCRLLKAKNPSEELRLKLFHLFKRCFDENIPLNKKRLIELQNTCNGMIIMVPLNDSCVQWLCDNAFNSENILNRVLRYPVKSTIISKWVKRNYTNTNLHNRRAELVSWLIDENVDFVISKQTLADDFEYLNSIDKKIVADYLEELAVNKMIETEFKETMENRDHSFISKSFEDPFLFPEFEVSPPIMEFTRRTHKVIYNRNIQDVNCNYAYDFDKMRTHFYKNLSIYSERAMLWAIYYSRIDNRQKTKLFKKFYSHENYFSFFTIAKRLKSITLLKFFKEQQELAPPRPHLHEDS